MKSLAVLFLLALVPVTASHAVDKLEVPLTIDLGYLDSVVADGLGLDAQGRAELDLDACNSLTLSDARVRSSAAVLEVSIAMTARTGAPIFGKCAGLRPVESRLHIELTPQVSETGSAALFPVTAIEIRGIDGQPGMLSTPVRMLAEALVLPRLETMAVELSEPLAAIDELIETFMPTASEPRVTLAERGRLARLEVLPQGLRAVLSFGLVPPLAESGVPEPILDPAELAQWQRIEDELDGFLTVVIVSLADQLDDRLDNRRDNRLDNRLDNRSLQLDLLAVLLDARHQIAEALASDEVETDALRRLFLDAWTALSPLLARADQLELAEGVDLRLAGFLAAGDALKALDALGPAYGLEISRDGLRRLARLLLSERAPASFTPLPLETDPAVRTLFGMAERGNDRGVDRTLARTAAPWWSWLISSAHAETLAPAEALRGVVPRLDRLDDYLALVARLIDHALDAHSAGQPRVPAEYQDLLDPLVRATAWKESCWRHYEGTADQPRVIRSPVGAIGMMQIMGRVWRGVYDIERLESEMDYNVSAGIEILEHYLVDYAIRRGEHNQSGGRDGLVRATYAAYNGGPSHLSRYRRDETPARLRAIDNAFWRDFQMMRNDPWPEVSDCYARE
ncbi:MAG: lytic transglycosylase domain-containing protein [Wenzhouxiangellaceae bacterium]